MTRIIVLIQLVVITIALPGCTSLPPPVEETYSFKTINLNVPADRILTHDLGTVVLAAKKSGLVTIVDRKSGESLELEVGFDILQAVRIDNQVVFIGRPVADPRPTMKYGEITPLAIWSVDSAEPPRYGYMAESMFASDAISVRDMKGIWRLVIADQDSRSLVVLDWRRALFVAVDEPGAVRFDFLMKEVDDIPTSRIGLEFSLPAQLLLSSSGELMFVRYTDSPSISVLETTSFRARGILEYSTKQDWAGMAFQAALLPNTEGFLLALTYDGAGLIAFNVGNSCKNEVACYMDIDRIAMDLDNWSFFGNQNRQMSKHVVERKLRDQRVLMTAGARQQSIFLMAPNSSILETRWVEWLGQIGRAIINTVKPTSLPFDVRDLQGDTQHKCIAAISSDHFKLIYFCTKQ